MAKKLIIILLLMATAAYAEDTFDQLIQKAVIAEREKDFKAATKYIEQAITIKADGELLCILGDWYSFGKNGLPNKEKALYYYDMAAQTDYLPGYVKAGTLYYKKENFKKAAQCYNVAWLRGNTEALWRYGLMQVLGEGMEKSHTKGLAKIMVALKYDEEENKPLRSMLEKCSAVLTVKEKARIMEEVRSLEIIFGDD